VFDFEMKQEDRYQTGPANGVLTYGLFLEGARWDKSDRALAESMPKVLFSPAPTMHWVPYRKADVPQYAHYKCPVYKTSDRRYGACTHEICAFSLHISFLKMIIFVTPFSSGLCPFPQGYLGDDGSLQQLRVLHPHAFDTPRGPLGGARSRHAHSAGRLERLIRAARPEGDSVY
jgi:hypothetical protein